MNAIERFCLSALHTIRESIQDADGNEVFFVGRLDQEMMVREITAAARGDAHSVPALEPFSDTHDVVIHNHPSGKLTPSRADLNLAARLGSQGRGFYIVDNDAQAVYVVAEPVPVKESMGLDVDELTAILEPGGKLSQVFPSYEARSAQIEMLEIVCRCFNDDLKVVVEAGTGVGKSLAYLLPVLSWVEKNDDRIVVSTATINLQQQLMERDIPLAKTALGIDPKVVLVKGRGNYLCKRRLYEAVSAGQLIGEDVGDLKAIRDWAETTDTGSLSDLTVQIANGIWTRVCSEAESCQGLRCQEREGCFVLKARRQAASAKVLVVNHHLLFADFSIRLSGLGYEGTAVLPPFRRIVFDEAHSIEASATSFFSESFSRREFQKQLSKLSQTRRGRRIGLLTVIKRLFPAINRSTVDSIAQRIDSVRDQVRILEHRTVEWMAEELSILVQPNSGRWIPDLIQKDIASLVAGLDSLISDLKELRSGLPDDAREHDSVFETELVGRRLSETSDLCRRWTEGSDEPQTVFWLEQSRVSAGSGHVRFITTPLDITPMMKEALYDRFPALVFTSATLAVGGSFRYWSSRVGLTGDEYLLPSPYNFRENVLLAIPTDAPPPTEPGFLDFAGKLIRDVIDLSEGRALVLFTSYSMLNEIHTNVRQTLDRSDIPLLRQGDDDRSRLLSRFREEAASVLFATDSFWQGVDAPGDSLEVLIISRLPFRVPSDPVIQARMEDIRNRGGNPFLDMSLPDAVIRLRQGFGRLMRRTTDFGAVIILDSRIVTKMYGDAFLSSLPDTYTQIGRSEKVLLDIEDFLVEKHAAAVQSENEPPPRSTY